MTLNPRQFEDMQRNVEVPLTSLVTQQIDMEETLAAYDGGRVSNTPDEPIWAKAREDMPGKWEIADGHHRVAAAMRAGKTSVLADLDPQPDDEPYEPPFYRWGD